MESLGYCGVLAARLGDAREARRIAGALSRSDRPHLFGSHTYWRARIAAVLGEADGAVALFRQAFAEGCPFDIAFHRDMDFESLRDFPPYQALLRPKDSGDGDSTASPRPSSR